MWISRCRSTAGRRLVAALSFLAAAALAACTTTSPTGLPAPQPTPPPSGVDDTGVQVWLTLPDQSRKLASEPALSFAAGPGAAGALTVDDRLRYQPFEGAGAAMTESSAWLILNKLTAEQRAALLDDLFTRAGAGIGLSYLRVPMGASDFALGDYSYDDVPAGTADSALVKFTIEPDRTDVIPALQAALARNPQLRLMGSPWSAPAWMKTSGRMGGGGLQPEYFAAFADYHVRFLQAYAEAGLPIDTLTPQNEPLHQTDGYPTMFMSARDQQLFVRDYLGPALRTAGLPTRLLILDHNWDLADTALEILGDPAAAAFVDGVAFHCYGGDVAAQSEVRNAYPDKAIWFTECSGGGWATDWSDNVSWNMQHLVVGNFRNWGRSLLLWNLALDENDGPQNGGCGNCRGVVTINQATGAVTYNEEYYVLGHITKFVDPGAERIDSQGLAGQVDHVAFANPDGSLVLIAHARTATDFTVDWNGQHFSYALPAQGTVTFKWPGAGRPGATVTPPPTSLPRPTPTPPPTAAPALAADAPVLAQGFEADDTYYPVYQAEASRADRAHSGQAALLSASRSGEWHTVGAYLTPRPLNTTGFRQVCFWVLDTTSANGGRAENTVGVRLIDAAGANEEKWTDHADVGANPKTVRDEWVQMCLNLAAYTVVDLSRLDRVEFALYWAGDYYFDDLTLVP